MSGGYDPQPKAHQIACLNGRTLNDRKGQYGCQSVIAQQGRSNKKVTARLCGRKAAEYLHPLRQGAGGGVHALPIGCCQ